MLRLLGLVVSAAVAGPRPAWGGPRSDPTSLLVDRWCRLHQADVLYGSLDRDALDRAWRFSRVDAGEGPSEMAEVLKAELGPALSAVEGASSWMDPATLVIPRGRVGAGGLVPDSLGGDEEPGLASLRVGVEVGVYPWRLDLAARPELDLDLALPDGGVADSGLALREGWLGLHAPFARTGEVTAGFGLRDRIGGPGRRGSLTLSDNARPAPAGSVAVEGRAIGGRVGRMRLEAGAGWLDGQRDDVQRPGWLFMDARWAPVPLVEVGATRVGLFGGVGRPAPSLSQLLLPTDPHVYDDPSQVRADQDELAALDFRLLLPVHRWLGGAVDFVEVWWQYGGEDVIERRTLGIPYPGLAGVGNLYGVEASAGPLLVTLEGARILDDTFRWYTGHRVYHDGFTQDGRVMGHAVGGDALDGWLAVGWVQAGWGLELSGENLRRVGVIGASGDNLFALTTDEVRRSVALRGWRHRSPRGWWQAGVAVERVTGEGFVPGADGWQWRVTLGG